MIRGDVYSINFQKPDKSRPALILTRTEAIEQLNAVTVIPVTTTIREIRSQIWLNEDDGMNEECVINVDNIQTISKQRIGTFITHLSDEVMNEVFEAMKYAFGFDK